MRINTLVMRLRGMASFLCQRAVGTSGGAAGLDRGYCLMIGGEADVVEHLKPIFSAFVPGVDAATRTPDATGVLPAPKKAFCTAARTAPVTSSR